MRRLVLLASNGALTEIDQKALRRESLALKSYIEAASKDEEQRYQYRKRVLPLVEAALNGVIQIPYKGSDPYNVRLEMEGLSPELPEALQQLYFGFMCRIHGSAICGLKSIRDYKPEIVVKDGKRYEWVEFED